MKFVETHNVADIRIENAESCEVEQVGPTVKSLTIRDAQSNVIAKIVGSYGIDVLVPAPPVYKSAYLVTGVLAGVPVSELYEDSYTADRRVRELAGVSETGDFKSTKTKALEDQVLRSELPSEAILRVAEDAAESPF